MKPGTNASIKAGMAGGSVLLIISIAFAYFFIYLRDQVGVIFTLAVLGYFLSFIAAGILTVHFSQRMESAAEALQTGARSGGVTALILVVAWFIFSVIVLMTQYLWYVIGLTFEMIILVMVGITISAVTSVIYSFIERNFDIRK